MRGSPFGCFWPAPPSCDGTEKDPWPCYGPCQAFQASGPRILREFCLSPSRAQKLLPPPNAARLQIVPTSPHLKPKPSNFPQLHLLGRPLNPQPLARACASVRVEALGPPRGARPPDRLAWRGQRGEHRRGPGEAWQPASPPVKGRGRRVQG